MVRRNQQPETSCLTSGYSTRQVAWAKASATMRITTCTTNPSSPIAPKLAYTKIFDAKLGKVRLQTNLATTMVRMMMRPNQMSRKCSDRHLPGHSRAAQMEPSNRMRPEDLPGPSQWSSSDGPWMKIKRSDRVASKPHQISANVNHEVNSFYLHPFTDCCLPH